MLRFAVWFRASALLSEQDVTIVTARAMSSGSNTGVWVLLITDGTLIEFPPEGYLSHSAAVDEARRWAWILSDRGPEDIREVLPDRWAVGDRDIRVVEASGDGHWVGTFWGWTGYPDPEAALFVSRVDAKSWVAEPYYGLPPASVSETPWSIAAVFERSKDTTAIAVAHRLKRVS